MIPDDHPYAAALLALAHAALETPVPRRTASVSESVAALWKAARPYRAALLVLAKAPKEGLPHRALMQRLAMRPMKFRGLQTGIARICQGLAIDNPIKRAGYAQANRVYYMEPAVARAIKSLTKGRKSP